MGMMYGIMVEGGAMRKIIIMLIFSILVLISTVAYGQEWWQKWDNYPKVPRITAKEVKNLMLAGEKIVFVYAGYEISQVVCGSFYIPYTKVPPCSDGSTVNFKIPKNYWIMCY
jgi:L-asparagine transporter-like permease